MRCIWRRRDRLYLNTVPIIGTKTAKKGFEQAHEEAVLRVSLLEEMLSEV